MQKLTIWEQHFSPDISITYWQSLLNNVKEITAAMARKSTTLEHLSVSCYVDVDDFFKACNPDWTWTNLKSLEFTCRLNNQEVSSDTINKMLVKSGNAALKMPRVNLMYIVEYHPKTVSFKYQVEAAYATLRWRGGPAIKLEPSVLNMWRKVVQLNWNRDFHISMKVEK